MKLLLTILASATIAFAQLPPEEYLKPLDPTMAGIFNQTGITRCRPRNWHPYPFPWTISLHQENGRLIPDARAKPEDLVWLDQAPSSDAAIFRYSVFFAAHPQTGSGDEYFEARPEVRFVGKLSELTPPIVFQRSVKLNPGAYLVAFTVRDFRLTTANAG